VSLATVAVAMGRLGLQPAILIVLTPTLGLVAALRVVMWTFADQKSNSIEIDDESISLTIGHPRFIRYLITVPYSSIDWVGVRSECGSRPIFPWPLRALGRHLDIGLKRSRVLAPGWRLGRFKVLHLGVDDPDALASLITRRLPGVAALEDPREN
jgi:hypothetical protein